MFQFAGYTVGPGFGQGARLWLGSCWCSLYPLHVGVIRDPHWSPLSLAGGVVVVWFSKVVVPPVAERVSKSFPPGVSAVVVAMVVERGEVPGGLASTVMGMMASGGVFSGRGMAASACAPRDVGVVGMVSCGVVSCGWCPPGGCAVVLGAAAERVGKFFPPGVGAVVVPVAAASGLVLGGLTPTGAGTVVGWMVSDGEGTADSGDSPGGVSVVRIMGCGAISCG